MSLKNEGYVVELVATVAAIAAAPMFGALSELVRYQLVLTLEREQ